MQYKIYVDFEVLYWKSNSSPGFISIICAYFGDYFLFLKVNVMLGNWFSSFNSMLTDLSVPQDP